MQTQFTSTNSVQTRPHRYAAAQRTNVPFPKDRPLGFTPRELRRMVAEMIG